MTFPSASELSSDPVQAAVKPGRVVNQSHNQLKVAVSIQICHRDCAVLVFPGKPVWNRNPGSPATLHVSVCIQSLADSIEPLVLPRRVIDHKNDQILPSIFVQVRGGYSCSLILEREPIGHVDPWRPAARGIPLAIQLAANPVDAPVLPPWIVDCNYEQILFTRAGQICDRDVASLVLAENHSGISQISSRHVDTSLIERQLRGEWYSTHNVDNGLCPRTSAKQRPQLLIGYWWN